MGKIRTSLVLEREDEIRSQNLREIKSGIAFVDILGLFLKVRDKET